MLRSPGWWQWHSFPSPCVRCLVTRCWLVLVSTPMPPRLKLSAEEYGWDRPVLVQLGEFYWQLFTTGDLGESIARGGGTTISEDLATRIPATIELTLAALALAFPLGVLAGVISARWRGQWPDWLFSSLALVGVSVPIFFLGVVLREVFTGLPTSQRLPPLAVATFVPITGLYLIDCLLRVVSICSPR